MPRRAVIPVLILLCVAGGVVCAAVRAPQDAPPRTAASIAPQVDALLASFLADAHVAGTVAGVTRGADTLVRGGWGMADREASRPMTADTSFRLGSTSKQFTAALIMRLVERGALGLDDLVERYLPDMPRKWRGITIRQALNHTSGVPDFTDIGSSQWRRALPPAGLLALVGNSGLQFAAGSKWEYSNSNYVMLGMIAEKLYDKPLARILHDELFEPLGLASMRFCEDEYGSHGQARPYVRDGSQIKNAPYRSVTHSFGAGGICSTVADVAAWNRALHGGRVLTAESYKLMTTPSGAANGERYGFGIKVGTVAGRAALIHSGLVPGFITVNAWIPSDDVSVTVLVNTSPTSQTSALHRDLARLALGLPVTIVVPTNGPRLDGAALTKYAGNFTIQVPGRPLDIRFYVDGDTLMSQAAGQNAAPLRAAGEHLFGAVADWSIRFAFTFDNGVVTGFDFEQAGQKYVGVRRR